MTVTTNHYHYGDEVTQYGNHNTGIVKNYGADPQVAFREMLAAVQQLRSQVTAVDREILDESLDALGTGENVQPGVMRRALATISGVAQAVGTAGLPVVQSVQTVLELMGP
ncbi:hypothetical protein ACWGB8_35310 [Kitasatospora sp. NPDC054939]